MIQKHVSAIDTDNLDNNVYYFFCNFRHQLGSMVGCIKGFHATGKAIKVNIRKQTKDTGYYFIQTLIKGFNCIA